MGPIIPVGIHLPKQSYSQTPLLGHGASLAGSPELTQAESLAPMSTEGQTRAISSVASAVSQLLQSIGGGVENDKTLRMLIVLMILLALLENSMAPQSGTESFLGRLAASGRQPQSFTYSSLSTIAIQQTTTTITIAFADSMCPHYAGPQSPSGTDVDIRI